MIFFVGDGTVKEKAEAGKIDLKSK